MKRQRSRNRGGGGNGGKPQHNANRAFDSNGPEGVKVRGAAQHVFETYQQLARDAGSAGDRVLAENYLQHAEHYFRTVRAMQPNRPVGEIIGNRDQFSANFDMDYEEEHAPLDPAEAAETEALQSEGGGPDVRQDGRDRNFQGDRQRDDYRRDERPRDERPRDEYRQRDDRPREDRQRDDYRARDDRPRDERPRDEYRQRDDRPREDRPREDRPREDRPPRDDRPRDERPRDDRPRDDRRERYNRDERRPRDDRPPRADRPDRDPLAVVEPQGAPLTAAREEEPSRFGSEAPAFLQSRPAAPVEAAAEEKKPRRRRAPKSFEGEQAPAEAEES
jgi:hypothetical protein